MKYFTISIPIWIGLLFAFIFPYYGLRFSSLGFSILFLLSFWNIFFFNFRGALKNHRFSWDIPFFMIIGYVLFPAVQMIMTHYLIKDQSLRLGLLLAVLSPVAVVCPQFLKQEFRDRAILYILSSTFLYAPLCYFYLTLFKMENMGLKIVPIIKDTLILTLLPLMLSFLFEMILPSLKQKIQDQVKGISPHLNMILIGLLVFVYFGASFSKTNYTGIDTFTMISLGFLAFMQDFGTYFLMRLMKFPEAETICLSIKNVALSGGVLLIFHPQGVLSCSLIFIAHALFFTFLAKKIKDQNNLQEALQSV